MNGPAVLEVVRRICDALDAAGCPSPRLLGAVSSAALPAALALALSGAGCATDDGGEGPDPEVCDDGVDDDGDGATDCSDADCFQAPRCFALYLAPFEDCEGGADEDEDGVVDCDDPDCSTFAGCRLDEPDEAG